MLSVRPSNHGCTWGISQHSRSQSRTQRVSRASRILVFFSATTCFTFQANNVPTCKRLDFQTIKAILQKKKTATKPWALPCKRRPAVHNFDFYECFWNIPLTSTFGGKQDHNFFEGKRWHLPWEVSLCQHIAPRTTLSSRPEGDIGNWKNQQTPIKQMEVKER